MKRRMFCLTIALALSGCPAQESNNGDATNNAPDAKDMERADDAGDETHDADDGDATDEDAPTNEDGCGEPEEEVRFTTEDDVELVADYWPADTADRGAVILLHMIPPNWDRTSYPPRIREGLHDLELTVLNLDRRGSGDSAGVPQDAYQGPGGALDVQAAVSFLLSEDRACAVDPENLMLVGASNGTTSTLDYVVGRTDLDLPDPAAMVWLSPGAYTETQYEIEPQRNRLEQIPILMIHPDNEPWAEQYAAQVDAWQVVELEGGAHGTQNFDEGALETRVMNEMTGWGQTHVAE